MAKKRKDQSAVYKMIELVGTSTQSWADAAKNAVTVASKRRSNRLSRAPVVEARASHIPSLPCVCRVESTHIATTVGMPARRA